MSIRSRKIMTIWCVTFAADFLLIWDIAGIYRQGKQALSRDSVKQALDMLPSGICYFTPSGSVKLCNRQMDSLFRTIAQSDLQTLKGLKITGNSGSTLTVNNTQTNSVPLYMYSGHDLIVDTDGSVIIKSAGKVLYGTSTVKLGTNVQMLRMEGTFTDELTPTFDELTGSYYLYNGTTGATAESPVEGVFLYGTGSNIPDFTVTVTGDASASVGGTAALTAGIPEEITGARKFNSKGEDVGAAFAVNCLNIGVSAPYALWGGNKGLRI